MFDPERTGPHEPAEPSTATPLPEAATPWPDIPGYEVLGELGHGGMGVVYQARQVPLKRLVALKMIRAGPGAGPELLRRFRAEAEAVARLRHENIIQVYEIGEHEGCPYFSLEYVEGGSLARQLAGGPLSARQAAALTRTLARAVQHAHEQGVVHRDLKPANVLLTAGGMPKVGDFGLAKRLDEESGHTLTGQVLGTPSYMAPEQAAGRVKEIGPAADVYALGAILYECLTGRPPFKGPTPLDTLEQVRHQEPVPPSRLQPSVPRDLELIGLKCLRKEPGRRYASAAELAEELRRFLAGEPLLRTRPVGRAERLYRWCKRHPARAAAAGLAALLLIATAVVPIIIAAQARAHSKELGDALTVSERNRKDAEKNLRRANYQLAENFLDDAFGLGGQGQSDRALLWLARALAVLPDDSPELEHVIRSNLGDVSREVCPLRQAYPGDGTLTALALSPDGRWLITQGYGPGGEQDKVQVRLWDVAVSQRAGEGLIDGLPSIPAGQAQVFFSPDSRQALLVSSGDSRKVRIRSWELAAGKSPGGPLELDCFAVRAAAFRPDGSVTLLASRNEKTWLCNGTTGKPVGVPIQGNDRTGVRAAAFSPDGKLLLTGSDVSHEIKEGNKIRWDERGEIRLWDGTTGQPLGPRWELTDELLHFALSPDGKTLLTGTKDGKVSLWESATGKPVGQPITVSGFLQAALFSGDGRVILTGSDSGVGGVSLARAWDATTGQSLGPPVPYDHRIRGLGLSPDGRRLVTGGVLAGHLTDLTTGRPVGGALPLPTALPQFEPDGRAFLAVSGRDVWRWEAPAGRAAGPVLHGFDSSTRTALSADGRTLVTGSRKAAGLWDPVTGKCTSVVVPYPGWLDSVAVSPDGCIALLAAREYNRAWLCDTATGRLVGRPLEHPLDFRRAQGVGAAAFTPDGRRVVTVSRAGVRFWDAATGESAGQPLPHQGILQMAVFSPDGKTLLTADQTLRDQRPRLWDVATGKQNGEPLEQGGTTFAAVFSPDSRLVATAGRNSVARLWEAATGRPVGQPLRHGHEVNAIAFSPDGEAVLTGSADQSAQLWGVATCKPVGRRLLHVSPVTAVAFTPDGRALLTTEAKSLGVVTAGSTTHLWDRATGKPLGQPLPGLLITPSGPGSLPPGRTALLRSGNEARLWELPAPLAGDRERVALWAQVTTGQELDAETGEVRALDAAAWQERKRRLDELGGPPQ
jgi:WD40 repeat protein